MRSGLIQYFKHPAKVAHYAAYLTKYVLLIAYYGA